MGLRNQKSMKSGKRAVNSPELKRKLDLHSGSASNNNSEDKGDRYTYIYVFYLRRNNFFMTLTTVLNARKVRREGKFLIEMPHISERKSSECHSCLRGKFEEKMGIIIESVLLYWG